MPGARRPAREADTERAPHSIASDQRLPLRQAAAGNPSASRASDAWEAVLFFRWPAPQEYRVRAIRSYRDPR